MSDKVTGGKISVYYNFNKSNDDRYMLTKEKIILDSLAQKYLVDFGWESECSYLVYQAQEWWNFNPMAVFYLKQIKNEEKEEEEDVNVGCNLSFCLII